MPCTTLPPSWRARPCMHVRRAELWPNRAVERRGGSSLPGTKSHVYLQARLPSHHLVHECRPRSRRRSTARAHTYSLSLCPRPSPTPLAGKRASTLSPRPYTVMYRPQPVGGATNLALWRVLEGWTKPVLLAFAPVRLLGMTLSGALTAPCCQMDIVLGHNHAIFRSKVGDRVLPTTCVMTYVPHSTRQVPACRGQTNVDIIGAGHFVQDGTAQLSDDHSATDDMSPSTLHPRRRRSVGQGDGRFHREEPGARALVSAHGSAGGDVLHHLIIVCTSSFLRIRMIHIETAYAGVSKYRVDVFVYIIY